jgi:hypothetical protein
MSTALAVRPLLAATGFTTLLTAAGEGTLAQPHTGSPPGDNPPTAIETSTPGGVAQGARAAAPPGRRATDPAPTTTAPAATSVARRATAPEDEGAPVRILPRAGLPGPPATPAAAAAPTLARPDLDGPAAESRIRPRGQSDAATTLAAADSPGSLGCAVGLGVSTAYASRGLNVFAPADPQSVAGLVAPSVDCELAHTGLHVAWLGAWQLSGPDIAAGVAAGVGAENDVSLAWAHELPHDLAIEVGATAIVYPFAEGATPVYLEPAARLGWAGPVDVGVELLWSGGVHDAPGVTPYVYVHQIGRAHV